VKGEPIRSVVIAGGGIAGWMAAACLARALSAQPVSIRVLDGPEGSLPELEFPELACLPALRGLHRLLGIDERSFMGATGSTFRLGTELVDWNRVGHAWMHPCGDVGASMESVGFHHHWLRVREHDDAVLDDFSIAAVAARLGRFSHPWPDPRSVLSTLSYAYHLDAALYAQYLRRYAEERGVMRTEGEVKDVKLRGEDGFIEAIVLASGERIEGDLFIDCSGPRGALIEQALQTGYEEWTHWLPCDRAVVTTHASASASAGAEELAPYTRATARKAGWQWQIPLQSRIGNGYVYCSRYVGDDEAAATLLGNLDGEALAEPRVVRFTTGRRKRFLNRNCVAIGPAAGFIEPLASTSIHLIQSGIARLLALFPDRSCDALSDEYNRLAGAEMERIRDFLILHYHLSARDDAPLWQDCSHMSIPETLERKVRLFASRGRVVMYDEETFDESSWACLFIGQRLWPRQRDPRAATIDLEVTRERLRRMQAAIRHAAESMPSHRAFLAEHGRV